MALQTTGPISIDDIRVELNRGGTTSLQDVDVRALVDKVQGEEISMDDFYGAENVFEVFVTSDEQELQLEDYATAAGWDGSAPILLTVNTGVWVHSRTTSTAGLTIPSSLNGLVTIENYGNIIGMGGGAAAAGGNAIDNSATGVTIINKSGAYIAGGGGGGGGSQGGGGAGQADPGQAGDVGGSYTYSQGISATVSPYGCSEGGSMTGTLSCSVTVSASRGAGGRQGASAGSGTSSGGCCFASTVLTNSFGCSPISYSATICGGGGTPNPGGQGGSILEPTNSTVSGGGWGLQGASGGGAGGAAISGTAATVTNNGTIYGTVAQYIEKL